jgi:hypothetical protein
MSEEKKDLLADLTPEELRELATAVEGLKKEPHKGFKAFVKSVIKPLKKRDKIEATYAVFKPHYDVMGKPFTRKDAKEVRENMLLFAQKLYEIHIRQVNRMEEQNE